MNRREEKIAIRVIEPKFMTSPMLLSAAHTNTHIPGNFMLLRSLGLGGLTGAALLPGCVQEIIKYRRMVIRFQAIWLVRWSPVISSYSSDWLYMENTWVVRLSVTFYGLCSIYQVTMSPEFRHKERNNVQSLWNNERWHLIWYIEHHPIWFQRKRKLFLSRQLLQTQFVFQ